jgi:hypothetical protein
VVSCKEGTNLISVVAFDKFGHFGSVTRRVIFQIESEIVSDIVAPAITDVFPGNRAVITNRNINLSATLVDDVGLDPRSVSFLFDDEEIDEYDLDVEIPDIDPVMDQYPIIHFSYDIPFSITEGQHTFKIGVEDTSGNPAESTYNFFVDTIPTEANVSVLLTDANQIVVIASANKILTSINEMTVYDKSNQIGYSLPTSFPDNTHYQALADMDWAERGFLRNFASLPVSGQEIYEHSLDISPSQRSFSVDFSAETYLGKEIKTEGYMTWNKADIGGRINLGSQGGARFSSKSFNNRNGDLIVILRSQDGIDAEMLALQKSDAEYRRLKPSGLAYVISDSERTMDVDIKGLLSLPLADLSAKNLVMFHWDDEFNRWESLDKIEITENALSSEIVEYGVYALFADSEPPVIRDVFPPDSGEIPPDKFLVEATISDRGSGVAEVQVIIDGQKADYEYDPENERLTYFPSKLEWGPHRMEIIATDHAGNVAALSTGFITEEHFQFIRILIYPNPANSLVNIEFKLTRVADVKLKIYTINGDLVYTSEEKRIADGKFIWKCENNSGSKIASGIYIYYIEASLYGTIIRSKGSVAVLM